MRIILTGATSFLGAAAARAFLRRGHEVYAPGRSDSKNLAALPSGPGMHVLKGDLGKSEELADVFTFCIMLADKLDVSVENIVLNKLDNGLGIRKW